MYDNTKLEKAIKNWIKSRCKLAFGDEYASDLLDSFIEHCKETGDMKRSPGRVVFGKQLAKLKLEKFQRAGLTRWAGIVMVKPLSKPSVRRYKKTEEKLKAKKAERQNTQEMDAAEKAKQKAAEKAAVKARMARESASRTKAVGGALD